MKFVVAGNAEQFEKFCYSHGLDDRTQRLFCNRENLRGRTFNPAVDEVLLVGTWQDRKDINEVMDILEEMQTMGRAHRKNPQREIRNPW